MKISTDSRYRKLYPRFWRTDDARKLDTNAKLLSLYCLTGPQSNKIGLYRFSCGQASDDLGFSKARIAKLLGSVCAAFAWEYDEDSQVLFIPSWWSWNVPQNPNNLVGCLKDLADVPGNPFIERFIAACRTLPETFHATLDERFGEPSGTPKPKPKPKPEPEPEPEPKPKPSAPEPTAEHQAAPAPKPTAPSVSIENSPWEISVSDSDSDGIRLDTTVLKRVTQLLPVKLGYQAGTVSKAQHAADLTCFARIALIVAKGAIGPPVDAEQSLYAKAEHFAKSADNPVSRMLHEVKRLLGQHGLEWDTA